MPGIDTRLYLGTQPMRCRRPTSPPTMGHLRARSPSALPTRRPWPHMRFGISPRLGSLSFRTTSHTTTASASGLRAMEGEKLQFPISGASLTSCSHYGPGFFGFFQRQNDKIANGTIKDKDAHYLHLDTLGIVNGLIDVAVQGEALITYPFNNVSFHSQLTAARASHV